VNDLQHIVIDWRKVSAQEWIAEDSDNECPPGHFIILARVELGEGKTLDVSEPFRDGTPTDWAIEQVRPILDDTLEKLGYGKEPPHV
jgi:hypothetical protein